MTLEGNIYTSKSGRYFKLLETTKSATPASQDKLENADPWVKIRVNIKKVIIIKKLNSVNHLNKRASGAAECAEVGRVCNAEPPPEHMV